MYEVIKGGMPWDKKLHQNKWITRYCLVREVYHNEEARILLWVKRTCSLSEENDLPGVSALQGPSDPMFDPAVLYPRINLQNYRDQRIPGIATAQAAHATDRRGIWVSR